MTTLKTWLKKREKSVLWFLAILAPLFVAWLVFKSYLAPFAAFREIVAFSQGRYASGKQASLQILALNRRNFHPLRNAHVRIDLQDTQGKRLLSLFEGKTDISGSPQIQFRLPETYSGEHLLSVELKAGLGRHRLRIPIRIDPQVRLLLTSDKPLYQPGQIIHGRALLFLDDVPGKAEKITLELFDSRNNRIFNKEHLTSDFGIAAAEISLAKEILLGTYTLQATCRKQVFRKTIDVQKYALPKYTLDLITDRPFYTPGQAVKGRIRALYPFGKSVGGADIELIVFRDGKRTETLASLHGTTNRNGDWAFEFPLPGTWPPDESEFSRSFLPIVTTARDAQGIRESKAFRLPLARGAIVLQLIPASGCLKRGLSNLIHVATSYPNGLPASCDVRIQVGGETKTRPDDFQKTIELKTDGLGLASFAIEVPEDLSLNRFHAEAEDFAGHRGSTDESFRVGSYVGSAAVLNLPRAIFEQQSPIPVEIVTNADSPSAFLEISQRGHTFLSRALDLEGGQARWTWTPEGDISGFLECTVRIPVPKKAIIWDRKAFYVRPQNDLSLDIQSDKSSYAPGETALFTFLAHKGGSPRVAALGVDIVDAALFSLSGWTDSISPFWHKTEFEFFDRPDFRDDSAPESGGERGRSGPLDSISKGAPFFRHLASRMAALSRDDQDEVFSVLLSVGETLNRRDDRMDHVEFRSFRSGVMEFFKEKQKGSIFEGLLFFLSPIVMLIALWRRSGSARAFFESMAGSIALITAAILTLMAVAFIMALLIALDIAESRLFSAAFLLALIIVAALSTRIKDYTSKIAVILFLLTFSTMGLPLLFPMNYGYKLYVPALLVAMALCFFFSVSYSILKKDGWLLASLTFFIAGCYSFEGIPHLARRIFGTSEFPESLIALLIFVFMLLLFAALAASAYRLYKEKKYVVIPLLYIIATSWMAPKALSELYSQWSGFPFIYSERTVDDREAYPRRGMQFGLIEMWSSGGILNWINPMSLKEEAYPQEIRVTEASPAPYVRQYFPETLCSNPEIITDGAGRATVSVPMADSISTWRLTAIGHDQNGDLGVAEKAVPVFKEVFIDTNLPPHLSVGDEIEIPVVVHNYSRTAQDTRLTVLDHEGFSAESRSFQGIRLGPNDGGFVRFRFRAEKIGRASVAVSAMGGGSRDAIRRETEIRANGREKSRQWNQVVSGMSRVSLDIPDKSIPGSLKGWVKIYPIPNTHVLENVGTLIRRPYGCFEQLTSVTFPNIMVAAYLKKTGKGGGDDLRKAEKFVSEGYQMQLNFEVEPGGFAIFRNLPAETMLTALGLMEFTAMAEVQTVDPKLISRVQEWLLNKIDNDHWAFDAHWGTPSSERENDLVATAYVARALLESGTAPNDEKLERALDYLESNWKGNSDNSYGLALGAIALTKAKRRADPLLKALDKLAVHDAQGTYWMPKEQAGSTDIVETTALAAMAYMDQGGRDAEIPSMINYLLLKKEPEGDWGTTQATILVLQALVKSGLARESLSLPNALTITVNGKQAGQTALHSGNMGLVHYFDIGPFLRRGGNDVELSLSARGALFAQAGMTCSLPWTEGRGSREDDPFIMDFSYDRTVALVGETVKISGKAAYKKGKCSYPILEIPIPPGFELETEGLSDLLKSGRIESWEVGKDGLILYLKELTAEGMSFKASLKAEYPCRVTCPPARIYDYYQPRDVSYADPVELRVQSPSRDSVDVGPWSFGDRN